LEKVDMDISQEWGEMIPLARRFIRSAYDAAYLVLADRLGEPLITGDERLYHAARNHLNWVWWVADYGAEG
jgi:predicted nucleic acid-binding protein